VAGDKCRIEGEAYNGSQCGNEELEFADHFRKTHQQRRVGQQGTQGEGKGPVVE